MGQEVVKVEYCFFLFFISNHRSAVLSLLGVITGLKELS